MVDGAQQSLGILLNVENVLSSFSKAEFWFISLPGVRTSEAKMNSVYLCLCPGPVICAVLTTVWRTTLSDTEQLPYQALMYVCMLQSFVWGEWR